MTTRKWNTIKNKWDKKAVHFFRLVFTQLVDHYGNCVYPLKFAYIHTCVFIFEIYTEENYTPDSILSHYDEDNFQSSTIQI